MRTPIVGACLAAVIAIAPVPVVLAAQSGADVPKLPASSWKPDKPVEFVVQSAAGGGSDIFARTIAKVLAEEKIVTVPINVVNKPGGSGAVAYSYLNQKKGDPYLIATATGSYITTPVLGHSPVSYKNFTNLAVLCVEDYVAVVRADSPYKSLKDLIAAAKQKPNSIRVGGSGAAGSGSCSPEAGSGGPGSAGGPPALRQSGTSGALTGSRGAKGSAWDSGTIGGGSAGDTVAGDRGQPVRPFAVKRVARKIRDQGALQRNK